eukprot:CAMPEP_0116932862 /NCGR_PEP_ID=MMETSP0467-20121206/28692_1 /TAXON_ID=283647 /ORGANISM="Mesodinium pulex, Strain SPMC105" /LENGTH=75 /DNA_ID=CAMNT_0004613629 /DNA_START=353 /DNA_END=580 /DNA_ORIENTATION=+
MTGIYIPKINNNLPKDLLQLQGPFNPNTHNRFGSVGIKERPPKDKEKEKEKVKLPPVKKESHYRFKTEHDAKTAY